MTITSTYASFVLDTGPNLMTGPGARHAAVSRLNYETQGFLARGKPMSRVVKGGQYLTDQLLLSLTPRAENIGILDSTTPAITETGVMASAYWRIMRTHIAWDERIRALNAGGSVGTDGGFQTYKTMKDNDYQEMNIDLANKIDDNLWAQPISADMEGASGKNPYSIPALVNEFTNGLPNTTATGTTAWTILKGMTAATTTGFSNYAPQRFSYNNVNVASPSNLIAAFDLAYEKLNFKAPPTNKQYFDDNSGLLPAQMFIACSPEGTVKLKQLCRNSQDRWDTPSDAYGGRPTYAGVPVVSVALLTTASIYPTGTSGAYGSETSTSNTNAGPRYFLINSNDLDLVVKEDWFMRPSDPQSQYGNPNRIAIFFETMSNLWARKRRTHGIVYPTANIP
jgi:hypothetical protein